MKKFQLKNKLKFTFMLALFCAFLTMVVFATNFGPNANQNTTASASESVVDDLLSNVSANETQFSLRDSYPILEENQTTSNLCWIYSSLKVLETSLMVQEGEYHNFSEVGMAYLAYSTGVKPTVNATGRFEDFATLAKNSGLIYQSDVSNDVYFDITDSNLQNYNYILDMPSRNIIDSVDSYSLSNDSNFKNSSNKIDIIKRYIKTYGGLFAGIEDGVIYQDSVHIYDRNKAIEADKVYLNGNHAVCLVGWNDSYGFLALNSWGTEVAEFYIPFNYEYFYETLYGYLVHSQENIEQIYSTANMFDEVTHYTNDLSNLFCYSENIVLKYKVSNAVSFRTVYISIFKGKQEVTNEFTINYDDENYLISLTHNASTSFVGGTYLVKVYQDVDLIAVKSFFVFTGTEINYFSLQKDNLLNTEDSEIFMSSFETSKNSVTYYLSPYSAYKLSFSLTDMNNFSNTGSSLSYTVSSPYAYKTKNGNTTSELVKVPFSLDYGIFCDISNHYTISIPQLFDHMGSLVKFEINIKTMIPEFGTLSRTYYVNIFVSNLDATFTTNSYAIEYQMNGGLNSAKNIERYPNYEIESNMTSFVLESPTKGNVNFVGWYLDPDFKTEIVEIDSSCNSDLVLYALWEESDAIKYFETSLEIESVVDYYENSKQLTEPIIYGDKVTTKYSFIPGQELEKFSYFYARYFYYLNGEEIEVKEFSREPQSVYKIMGFPDLQTGEYELKFVLVVVVSHNMIVSDEQQISFSVGAKEITLEYSDTQFVYDGEYHIPKISISEDCLLDEDDVNISFEEEPQMNAGIYIFRDILVDNHNYKVKDVESCEMVIRRKSISVSWESLEKVYNGKNQSPTYKINGLCGQDFVSFSVVGNEQVDVGEYYVTIRTESISNLNYMFDEAQYCTFKIKPATVYVTFKNVKERTETMPENRKGITYQISGDLYDDESMLKISYESDGLTAMQSGSYPIVGSYQNSNYNVVFNEANYVLTGYYYVFYQLPNGEIYKEEVEDGYDPVGINQEIYPISMFQQYEYSEELKNKGEDLHIVVTVKDYTWLAIVIPLAVVIFAIYYVVTSKQRKNKVS